MFIKNIFTAYEKQINLVANLENQGLTSDSYYVEQNFRKELLKDIAFFTKNVTWLKQKSAKEKVELFIRNDFNSATVATILGLDLNSVRASITHASKTLEKVIGKSILTDLEDSENLSDVATTFRLNTGVYSIESILIPQFLMRLPESKDFSHINLADCSDELRAFRNYTTLFIQSRVLDRLDKDKLAYIMHIIQSKDVKYNVERNLIFNMLHLRIEDVPTLIEYLKSNEPTNY